MFTSGSAVFKVFGRGNATEATFAEDAALTLVDHGVAPPSAAAHPMILKGLGAAMAARAETEVNVLAASGVRGIVTRPGLVYRHIGSYDGLRLIEFAGLRGTVHQYGVGETRQGFVHVDELGSLFALPIESADHGAVLHGISGEVSVSEIG